MGRSEYLQETEGEGARSPRGGGGGQVVGKQKNDYAATRSHFRLSYPVAAMSKRKRVEEDEFVAPGASDDAVLDEPPPQRPRADGECTASE